MPEQFGKPVGSLKALKQQLKKKGGSGSGFIAFIPKEPGSLTVRFLQEPDTFITYEECWNATLRKSFPYASHMKEGSDFDRKSEVYLANALDVEKDRVIALQVKQSVLNSLVIKYEKYGTLMDRDYEIARYGEGLDTTYDVTPEAPMNRKLDKYTLLDLHNVIKQAYLNVFPDEGDDEEDAAPRKAAKATKSVAVAGKRRIIRRS